MTFIEHAIYVMDEIISQINRISNYVLNSISLDPWLSCRVIFHVVSPEEWIEHSNLVHHDPEILRRDKFVSRDISTCEWMACYTLRK